MNRSKFTPIGVGLLYATLLFPPVTNSQETEPGARDQAGVLEEVVVTARRRDEALQDVPISIIVRSGDYLQKARIEGMTELSRVVPGFVFNEFEAGQQSTAMLRGLSTYSFETHAPQSVTTLVDDVVLATIGQSVTEFNDIERIEVLRGPQGTLFGRNTTGGAVHIVTKDPTDEFEVKASVGYGSYDDVTGNGTVNLPIADDLAARVSAFAYNRDGFIENINNGQKLSSEEEVGVRAKLLYTPRPGTQFKLTGTYLERDQLGRADPGLAFGPASSQRDIDNNAEIVGPENDKVNGRGAHRFKNKVFNTSLIWEQAIGELELTSITAFAYWNFIFGDDEELFRSFNPPDDPPFWHFFFVEDNMIAWSQEVRLASPAGRRLEYVVGAFHSGMNMSEERDFRANVVDDPDPAAAIFIFDVVDQDPTKRLDYAFFGEADFHLTDEWTVTGGLRWTHDETDITVNANPVPGFIPEFGIGFDNQGRLFIPILDSEFPGVRDLSVSANELTWRAGLRWEPSPDLMFYGSAARGFKGPTITALSILTPVEPEIVQSYELGTKASFLNNRLTAALTVFRSDIDDFQAQGVVDIETPGGQDFITIFLTNAAEARTQGVEFELSAALTDQLTFDMGLAYIDAEFESYPDAACFSDQTAAQGCITDPATGLDFQDLSGTKLPLVPQWSGNFSMTYDFTLPFWSLKNSLRVDYNYQDEINWDSSLCPRCVSDAYDILGLSLSLSSPDDRYEVVGFVKNLTDEFVVNGLSGGNGTIETGDLQPEYQRTWGVRFNYRF